MLDGLPRDRPIATICASGYRSSVAASLLRAAGFEQVASVAGGIPTGRRAATRSTYGAGRRGRVAVAGRRAPPRATPRRPGPALSPTWTPNAPSAATPSSTASRTTTSPTADQARTFADAPVAVVAHQPAVVDEQDHEHEHDRQQQALEVLRADDHRQQVEPRDEHDQRADDQHERVDREERPRVAEALVDPRLPAERLADHEGRRSGMIVAARTLAPNSPTANSASASRPATGSRAFAASAADVIVPRRTDRARRGDDDEDRDDVRPDRAADRVGLLEPQLVLGDALLGDGARQVELHVGRDRRPDDRDHQQQLGRREIERGVTSARPTAPSPGRPGSPTAMYARNTTMTPRKTRSTVR